MRKLLLHDKKKKEWQEGNYLSFAIVDASISYNRNCEKGASHSLHGVLVVNCFIYILFTGKNFFLFTCF